MRLWILILLIMVSLILFAGLLWLILTIIDKINFRRLKKKYDKKEDESGKIEFRATVERGSGRTRITDGKRRDDFRAVVSEIIRPSDIQIPSSQRIDNDSREPKAADRSKQKYWPEFK